MIVPGSRALGTAEHDVVGVVYKFRINIDDGVLASVLFSIFHLLLCRLAMSERLARFALVWTVLALGKIRSSSVFLLVSIYAPPALQHELLMTDFGDQMFSVGPIPYTVLVVRKRAALAVDQRCNTGTVEADFTAFDVA